MTIFAYMIELWIAMGTVEWCVIGFMAALSVLAAVLRPSQRHEAMTYFIKGEYVDDDYESTSGGGAQGDDGKASLEVYVGDSGPVFMRRGFDGLLRCDGSTIALAITIKGADITIKERIAGGAGEPYRGAVSFDCSALRLRGSYHIQYISDEMSRSTAFSLLMKPGVRVRRDLRL